MKNYSENKNDSRYLPSRIEKKILFKLIDKKPIIPNNKELNLNPASRSAKLRYGVKLNNYSDFDELYNQAVSIIIQNQKASTSFLQRHLQIGYNRAARIIEQMEKEGIISDANHVGKRSVLKKNN